MERDVAMNLSDSFKKNAQVQVGAVGTIGLAAVALLAGYNGHVIIEGMLAFSAGLTAGTTLWQASILMDDAGERRKAEKTVAPPPKMQ